MRSIIGAALVASVLTACGSQAAAPGTSVPSAPPTVTATGPTTASGSGTIETIHNVAQMKTLFSAADGTPRLIILMSPT